MIVGHTFLVNCTSDVSTVFFDSILQTSAGLSYVERLIFSGHSRQCFVKGVMGFMFGCIKMDFKVVVPVKMTCTVVCWKILLDSSLRPGTFGTEMKILFKVN